jgi:hypothetical protein
MKTFADLEKGDILYRLDFLLNLNDKEFPTLSEIKEFTICSIKEEILDDYNKDDKYLEITYKNSKEFNGCYVPKYIVNTEAWKCRNLIYSTSYSYIETRRDELEKAIIKVIDKEIKKHNSRIIRLQKAKSCIQKSK